MASSSHVPRNSKLRLGLLPLLSGVSAARFMVLWVQLTT